MQARPKLTAGGAYWAFILTGVPLVLAAAVAVGLYSREVTIAVHLAMAGVACWIIASLARRNRSWGWPLLLAVFFLVYSARILVEGRANRLGKPTEEYLFFLWGTVFLPSLATYLLGASRRVGQYDAHYLLLLGTGFTLIAWRSWGFLLEGGGSMRGGQVEGGVQIISPLFLSYLGSACLVVGIWAASRIGGWGWKLCASLAGVSGLLSIYLGASRGPLVATVTAGMAYVMRTLTVNKSRGRALLSGVFMLVFLTAVIVVMIRTGSGATRRLASMQSDFEAGASSMSRLELYESAWRGFTENPMIGSALEVQPGAYPHNIILEALMSCGVFGFLYVWFIVSGTVKGFRELQDPTVGWLALLLIFYLTGNMVSGSIWGATDATCLVMYFHGRQGAAGAHRARRGEPTRSKLVASAEADLQPYFVEHHSVVAEDVPASKRGD